MNKSLIDELQEIEEEKETRLERYTLRNRDKGVR